MCRGLCRVVGGCFWCPPPTPRLQTFDYYQRVRRGPLKGWRGRRRRRREEEDEEEDEEEWRARLMSAPHLSRFASA